ncbi:hypothetical protein TNCV_2155871 [Trichonephila clavipes]|nr:hypothetical protein TNCV_2155871 [Trichonephila clavipes]
MEFYSAKGPTYGRSLGGGHKVSEISPHKRALGRSRLTYEEFETVIIQIKPLAENNKGNSGSLEKMEYRLSEYSPTERKVDDREGQCNVWYNGNCKGGFYTSLQLAFRACR